MPQAVPFMLQSLDFSMEEPHRAVVAAPSGDKSSSLLHAVHSVYQPNKVVLGTRGPVEPFAKTLESQTGQTRKTTNAVVFVCTGSSCRPPTSNAAEIKEFLR